jgi:hypothetical protein
MMLTKLRGPGGRLGNKSPSTGTKEIVLDDDNAADIEDGDRVDEEEDDDEEEGSRGATFNKKKPHIRALDSQEIEIAHTPQMSKGTSH